MKELFFKAVSPFLKLALFNEINSVGEIFLVGGGLRDFFIRGYFSHNELDFLVIGCSLEELIKILKKYGSAVYVGKKFGVIKFFPANKEKLEYDFAIPEVRSESGLPDVIVDLLHRDFSINSMALSLKSGEFFDPFGGISDIEKKLIRLTRSGNFGDDPVRLIRAIRLATELGFDIDQSTWDELCQSAEMIKNEAPERIRDEFVRLIMLDESPRGFRLMKESGLLTWILPELELGSGMTQAGFHEHDVFEHILLTIKYAEPDIRIKLAALFHDIAKPLKRVELDNGKVAFYGHDIESVKIAKRVLTWMRFPNDIIEDVTTIVRYHMFSYGFSDKGLRRFIRRVGAHRMPLLIKLRFADSMAQHEGKILRDEKEFEKRVLAELNRKPPLSVRDLVVDGYDIMDNFSLKQGPIIGKVLNHLLSIVLDNPKNNQREILLERAKEYLEKLRAAEKVEDGRR